MALTPTKFQIWPQNLGRGVYNLNTDTLKVLLTNTAPNAATHAVRADITEISAGNGYSAGGATVGSTAYSQTGGTGKLTGSDVVFTASGGPIGPFRYLVLCDDTPTSPADPLIQYYDHGSAVTIPDGSNYTLDFDPSTGILTVT